MPIHTVLGPIEPTDLGRTSMHEHVLIDARVWYEPSSEAGPADGVVRLENFGYHRWNLIGNPDNLVLDDVDAAAEELALITEVGGSGVVDLSNDGLGRDVSKLPDISRRSGVHIMAASGCYVDAAHPDWVETSTETQLADRFISELVDGLDGTDIRAALLGEIGTSDPVTPREWKVLAAAADAAVRTGSSISIHLDARGTNGVAVFEFLAERGVTADRIVLGHVDEHLDLAYHRDMIATGSTIAYDTFGSDYAFNGLFKDPADDQRLEVLLPLLRDGHAAQIVLACDVFTKIHTRRFGGFGYDHLLRRILPLLRAEGISETELDTMLIDNPRRLLDRP